MLAIIPARGGSKGIHRKNLINLCGRPLIEYTIRAALESCLVSKVILSTEDAEIASLGREFGLDMSYMRPTDLAKDDTSMTDTINHYLKSCVTADQNEVAFIILQPTSPLRSSEDIDNAIQLFFESDCNCLAGVNEMSESPYECIESKVDGHLDFLRKPNKKISRRQDYEGTFYFVNGSIYIYKYKYFFNNGCFINLDNTKLYVMDPHHSIDIDTLHDLAFAEFLLTKKQKA
jgi:CMP-N,N'-diacetyllegionaminic acid synthase